MQVEHDKPGMGDSELADPAGLKVIKNDYDKAFELLYEARMYDRIGHQARMLELYRQAQQHLLHGVSVCTTGEICSGPEWDSAKQMQQKMMEALSNINNCLTVLSSVPAVTTLENLYLKPHLKHLSMSKWPLPSRALTGMPSWAVYPLKQPEDSDELPVAYTPQAAGGHSTQARKSSLVGNRCLKLGLCPQVLRQCGQELLFIPWGVQIFFVAPDRQVDTLSYPGYLCIIRLASQGSDGTPKCQETILQVCDWMVSLTADLPVLLCSSGVFMFPDKATTTPGSYVGVVLSSELPVSDRKMFQDQLLQLTDLRMQIPGKTLDTLNLSEKVPLESTGQSKMTNAAMITEQLEEKPMPEWSEKVSHGILLGAVWMSRGLVKGGECTSKAIHKGAAKLREHITPEDMPAEVSPGVTKGLQVAKQATGGAVKVSHLLVDGMCQAASCVGRELAPHVKKYGSRLIPESLKKGKEGNANVRGAVHVASSGMQGLATVWSGLEMASKRIGKSMTTETVSTVKYKFRGLENI